MKMQQTLTQFLIEEILHDRADLELLFDDNLLTSGLLDSLGVMQLVNFIEEAFSIEVKPEDITIENFQTINVIASFLQNVQESQAQW